jgi:GNAT-like C-terminal domain/N-acyltransferase N-terminal domain
MAFLLEHVAARLRIPSAGQALCTDWDAAMNNPLEQALPYLEPGFIALAAQEVGLTDAMIKELVAFAARITLDEAVVVFFWYCHHRILNDHTLVLSWEEQWPALDESLGQEAGLLNVLVMLSAVPEMRETFRRLGIPADIVRDTVADLRLWMETDLYYQRYHRWGITPLSARWLCRHWQGKLLQLKRLQFCMDTFGGHLHAYRKREGRELVALSEPGIRYCRDGNAWCDLCGNDSEVWTSRLKLTDDAVIGNEITPDGLAHLQTRRLPREEWELALEPGEAMLSLHIPANGPMTFDDCGESFRQAMEVFPRYFPEFNFRGFDTGCWFLDTRLQPLLSPESNIIRMQRELYLFPGLQGDNQQIYHRVFGWGVTDINHMPWRTSLQKAVGGYLNNGGHFHGGYGFLLKEDFAWGNQVYRSGMAA